MGTFLHEYARMFSLTEEDCSKRIIGNGYGPVSFNVEAQKRVVKVTTVDPIYAVSKPELEQRFKEAKEEILSQTQINQHLFIWGRFASTEDLERAWSEAMNLFHCDIEKDLSEASYTVGAIPFLLRITPSIYAWFHTFFFSIVSTSTWISIFKR